MADAPEQIWMGVSPNRDHRPIFASQHDALMHGWGKDQRSECVHYIRTDAVARLIIEAVKSVELKNEAHDD